MGQKFILPYHTSLFIRCANYLNIALKITARELWLLEQHWPLELQEWELTVFSLPKFSFNTQDRGMSFSSSAKYFASPFLHDWIGPRYILFMKSRLSLQHPLDLNVAFPDFLTVLKCAWLLAEFSDSDTEIAVEVAVFSC